MRFINRDATAQNSNDYTTYFNQKTLYYTTTYTEIEIKT